MDGQLGTWQLAGMNRGGWGTESTQGILGACQLYFWADTLISVGTGRGGISFKDKNYVSFT